MKNRGKKEIKARCYLLGYFIFFRRFLKGFSIWQIEIVLPRDRRPGRLTLGQRHNSVVSCTISVVLCVKSINARYDDQVQNKNDVSSCITFRFDERKRSSQASQFRHMRNCGFESRDVHNISGLSPRINEDSDNCTSFLVRRGYIFFFSIYCLSCSISILNRDGALTWCG